MQWVGWAIAVIFVLLYFTSCADTKHVGNSQTWTGDMGHGASDGGVSQYLREHP